MLRASQEFRELVLGGGWAAAIAPSCRGRGSPCFARSAMDAFGMASSAGLYGPNLRTELWRNLVRAGNAGGRGGLISADQYIRCASERNGFYADGAEENRGELAGRMYGADSFVRAGGGTIDGA